MKKLKKILALSPCLALVLPVAAMAIPSGGKVVGGRAQISQSGATTTINQATNRAIINWQSFDIGQNETVTSNMPSVNSAGLYRVIGGGGASQLAGLLQANGNIFLVNPAGVIIHNGARVETGGFVASTADISNKDFMRGNYLFNKPGQAGATIINEGLISVRDSGFAALVAPWVRNDGIITAKLGKVALASGETFKLDVYGDDLITFTTPEQVVDTLHTADGLALGVENTGTIKAEGGTVLLTARQLDGVVSSVVNNSGLVSAASAEMAGGQIVFKGEGANVDVVNSGTVDVSSGQQNGGAARLTGDGQVSDSGVITATGGQRGGGIVLTGDDVALTGRARLDASGNYGGGGTVLIGGNAQGQGPEKNAKSATVGAEVVIKADAVSSGNGGQVVVWSDGNTVFNGAISAQGGQNGGDGGWVETSGQTLKVGDTASVNTSAPVGKFGTWLLDPMDFTIAASGGDMTGTLLSSQLQLGNVTIQSSQGRSGANGDISVNADITWYASTILTLSAFRDVNVSANITATGNTAGLDIEPGSGGAFNLAFDNKVTLSGANTSLTISGQAYTVINSLQALQDMNQNLAGYYALGSDIDASATSGWNGGAGFVPIGGINSNIFTIPFTGVFHGLGHAISDLTIKSPTAEYVGLFGQTGNGSQIYNIGIVNAVISGLTYVGSLVGLNSGTIYNSYSTGAVTGTGTGTDDVGTGGLVGWNTGTISNSYNTSAVTGTGQGTYVGVGGLVGRNNGGTISNSYNTGAVTGTHYMDVGGLVGWNEGGTISNSYSTGAVTGIEGPEVGTGGLVGWNSGTISNSYSTGAVTGTGDVGGLVGYGSDSSTSNSYWDTQTSGCTTSAGGTGLTTAQMESVHLKIHSI